MPVQHVLVVDDSKSARLMLRRMLQGFGITVDVTESADAALEYLRGRRPDAIFMDHTMPGMDGLTALKQIKGDTVTAAIPVVMYTSRDDSSYRDHAEESGAIGVLIKPANSELLGGLLDQINTTLERAIPQIAVPEVAVTADWVEKIALEKAEMMFFESIESQVLPLMNDVVSRLKDKLVKSQNETAIQAASQVCDSRLLEMQVTQDEAARKVAASICEERLAELEAQQETIIGRVASQVCEARLLETQVNHDEAINKAATQIVEQKLSTWQPPEQALQKPPRFDSGEMIARVGSLMDERLHAFQSNKLGELEKVAHDIAVQTCQNEFRELSERLLRQLSQQFNETTQKTVEVAHTAADQVARAAALKVAQDIAEAHTSKSAERATAIAEGASQRLWIKAQRDIRFHIYFAAAVAAMVGMGAALTVYILLQG